MSNTYAAAIEAHNIAIRKFHAVRDAFRAGTVDTPAFLVAKAEYDAATAEFDVAFAAEAAAS